MGRVHGVGLLGSVLAAALTMPNAVLAQVAVYDEAYRIERTAGLRPLARTFTPSQLALLEKLNRAEIAHLTRLQTLVVPASWEDELAYSVLPARYPPGRPPVKLLIVFLPGQLFGAYESGSLVRWGPISSGRRRSPTPAGQFTLNWRSTGRASTVNPNWFMRWCFNYRNAAGAALHAYALPGYPASHGCIRLLDRDARWLFEWGEPWKLDPGGTRILQSGTPLSIVGAYDFDAAPPWRSLQ